MRFKDCYIDGVNGEHHYTIFQAIKWLTINNSISYIILNRRIG